MGRYADGKPGADAGAGRQRLKNILLQTDESPKAPDSRAERH